LVEVGTEPAGDTGVWVVVDVVGDVVADVVAEEVVDSDAGEDVGVVVAADAVVGAGDGVVGSAPACWTAVGTATAIAVRAAARPRVLLRVRTGNLLKVLTVRSDQNDRNDCGIVITDRFVTQNGGFQTKSQVAAVSLRSVPCSSMAEHRAGPLIIAIRGRSPDVHDDAWAAPNATLIGQVRLAARASVWYSATLRAEVEPIDIGAGSNIQDGVTIHVDPEYPVRVGAGVSVGHNAVLHGCTVEDGALIGMGAVVLNGAVIGAGSLIAAGALVPQGIVIPPRSLVAGVPGRVRRELADAEVAANRHNATVYEHLMDLHRDAT
jgi:carbonic anhydrase/acetyltransferase-like protein (isoleucine patch superfamily)